MPTATLFGTSVVSTFSVSTIVSTEIIEITPPPGGGFTTLSTCIPTLDVSSSATCSPTIIVEPIYSIAGKCCSLGATLFEATHRLRAVERLLYSERRTATDSD